MGKRHLKNCSKSLAIREMHLKTTLRYHITQIRMAKIKTPMTICAGEDVKKKEHSSIAGGSTNL